MTVILIRKVTEEGRGGEGVPAAGSTDLSNDDHQEIVPDTTAPVVLSGDDDNVMTKADLLGDLLRLIKGSQDPPIHMLNVCKKYAQNNL